MKPVRHLIEAAPCVILTLLVQGCALRPPGTDAEASRLQLAGEAYRLPPQERALLELSAEPDWREVLRRAFLANGDLEAAYYDWAAAVAEIDSASAWPNADLRLGFDYMFSSESMKSWNRTTLSTGFKNDELTLPMKARQSGKVALAAAQAAGARFYAKKFELQRKVLQQWSEFALAAEKLRIQRANVDLLRFVVDSARGRVRAGGLQQDLVKADVALVRAEDELKSWESEIPQMRAMLNSMLGREPSADLNAPKRMPALRPISADDSAILRAAAENNPELAELAHRVQGRNDAVELARMMYLPDISPTAALTGDMSQALGAMVMLPTNLISIRAEIQQMRAMLAATESMLRQARLDRAGQVVAALYAVRNYERQIELFRKTIVPASERLVDLTRQSYATGGVGVIELIDSQRMLLDARLMLAEASAGREKRLAELEALAGLDIESLESLES